MTSTDLRQRLAAILAADAAGYSRLMATDERGTIAALDAARAIFHKHIESHQGRVVDTAGDSVLAVFETATGATCAALAAQDELDRAGQIVSAERRLLFRIGLHLGEVIEKTDGSVYGDGVNVAARLQAMAQPGGIIVSDSVRNVVRGKVGAGFDALGEKTLKNIAEPLRVFRVNSTTEGPDPTAIAHQAVRMTAPVPGFAGRPAIAVLPFTNMSDDPDQEYFADGLAEDILTRLAMWRWFPIISRGSSFTFKGHAVNVKEVGRALGARYALEGSVRKSGDRLRVTAQLIHAETGHHLWAERYDRRLEDLFAIQDELTDGIAGALEAAVGTAERERALVKPLDNLDAWDALQRGLWHYYRLTQDDFAIATRFFSRAAELDPGIAPPLSALAILRSVEGVLTWKDSKTAFAESATYAQRALRISSSDARAHVALCWVLAYTGKPEEAVAIGKRAVELNASDPSAYRALGIALLFCGLAQEGAHAIEVAIRVSPNDPFLHLSLVATGACYYTACNYDRAIELTQLAIRRGGVDIPYLWRVLAMALAQVGRIEEAGVALASYLRLSPHHTTETAVRASLGFKSESLMSHWLEGLRKAGWQG